MPLTQRRGRPPLELGDLRAVGQRVAGAEQRLDVDAVVDGVWVVVVISVAPRVGGLRRPARSPPPGHRCHDPNEPIDGNGRIVRSDHRATRRGGGTVQGMGSWSPVPLPRRFAAARQTRLVGRHYELGVLERSGHGSSRATARSSCRGRARRGQDPAGRRGGGGAARPRRHRARRARRPRTAACLPAVRGDPRPPVPARRAGLDGHAACGRRLRPRQALDRGRTPPARRRRHGRRRAAATCSTPSRSCSVGSPGPPARRRPRRPALGTMPTVALLEHVVHVLPGHPGCCISATFRTTAPDRSDELSDRLADLHRLDGVRRLDLGRARHRRHRRVRVRHAGASRCPGRGPPRRSCATDRRKPVLPPRDSGSTWNGAAASSPSAAANDIPASSATPWARGWPASTAVRETVDLAAVIGDNVDLPTLVRAGPADRDTSMDAIDAAAAVGVLEPWTARGTATPSSTRSPGRSSLDRLPHTRCTALHARVAQAWRRTTTPRWRPGSPTTTSPRTSSATRSGRGTTRRGRPAGRAQPGLRGGGAVVRPGRHTARDARRTSGRSFVRGGDEPRAGGRLRPGPGDLRAVDHDGRPAGAPAGGDGSGGGRARPGLADCRAADLLAGALADSGLDPDDPRHVRGQWQPGPGARVRRPAGRGPPGWAASRSTPRGAPATGPP